MIEIDYTAAGMGAFRNPEVAEAYATRPSYPLEAVHYLLEELPQENMPLRILDAGCGNGLLTDGLISERPDAEIFGLDQSEAMIAEFSRRIGGGAVPVIGSFNTMPFLNSRFNIVTFGTSIHWADPDLLPTELYRILRPDGIVARVSNATRVGTEFTEILETLPGHVAESNRLTPTQESLELGPGFLPMGSKKFCNDIYLTPKDFDKLLTSISLFETAPPALVKTARAAMQAYANSTIVDGFIPVPFDTFVSKVRTLKGLSVGELACR